LTIGPPTVAPQRSYFVSGLSSPFSFAKKSFSVRLPRWKYPNALPRTWFVPCFVTALMIAPAVRPNSASYWSVMSLITSASASNACRMARSRCRGRLIPRAFWRRSLPKVRSPV